MPSSPSSPKLYQCIGVTKKNERCKKRVATEDAFCAFHKCKHRKAEVTEADSDQSEDDQSESDIDMAESGESSESGESGDTLGTEDEVLEASKQCSDDLRKSKMTESLMNISLVGVVREQAKAVRILKEEVEKAKADAKKARDANNHRFIPTPDEIRTAHEIYVRDPKWEEVRKEIQNDIMSLVNTDDSDDCNLIVKIASLMSTKITNPLMAQMKTRGRRPEA